MSVSFMPRRVDHCKGCPLESTPERSKHVPTEVVRTTDKKGVDVFFVGEAPGENEAQECRPFIGKSGKFVRNHISKYANANYAIGNTTRCLEASTLVHLEDGSWSRIDALVKSKYKGKVWSVDGDDRLVLRKVTGWYTSKLGSRTLYRVSYSGVTLRGGRDPRTILTNDHEVLTLLGWVRAENLVNGNKIAIGDGLSQVAEDVLIGSLLGDGSMADGKSSYLHIVHSIAQQEWCELKGKALSELGVVFEEEKEHKDGRGENYVGVRTASTRALQIYQNRFYPNGKRIVPRNIHLNERILAVWFLDNGYTRIRQGKSPLSEIACHAMSDASIAELAHQMNCEWGLDAYIRPRDKKRIFFRASGSKTLSDLIAAFVPPSMRYKLHPESEKKIPFNSSLYHPGKTRTLYAPLVVEKLEQDCVRGATRKRRLRSDSGSKKVYCLDVEGTHNFVTSGGVVHNCRPTDQDGNNRAPTPEERAHCFRYTLDQIHKLKPKKIVTLGGVATGAFIDGFSSVAAIRGRSIPWKSPKGFDTVICPTYHPAARDMYQLTFVPKDIKKAFEKEDEKTVKWDRPFKTRTVLDLVKIKKLIKHMLFGLDSEDVIEVDVETTNGLDRINNRLLSIAFCWDGEISYSFPLEHNKAPWTPQELKKIKKWLRRLFTQPNPSFRFWEGHNAMTEIQQIHTYLGIWARNRPWLDTMLLTFLNDENRLTLKKTKNWKPYGLKDLTEEKLGIRYSDYVGEELLKDVGKGNLPKYPVKAVCEYNGLDTITARRLHDKEKADAGGYWETMLRISEFIYAPALLMFSAAEKNGFKIDIDLLYELQGPNSPVLKAMKEIDVLFREDEDVIAVNKKLANKESGGMRPMFGSPWVFSLDKKQHMMKLFIDRLGFDPVKFSKKTEEPSLDGDYYETYSSQSPLAKKMVERQEIKKLITSYFNQILDFLENDPECADGRVRPSFWLNSTVTGRTSCSNPNLQQIPRAESDYSKAAKNMFTVEPGNVLVSADCTQGEVILMAQTCNDKLFASRIWRMKKIRDKYWRDPSPELKKILETECDAHRQSASILYEVPIDKVTKEQRSEAKSVVTFGIIYGKHIKTIAADLGKTEEQAQAVQDRFFSKFKDSKKGLMRLEKMAESLGYVESSIGRRRRLPQAMSTDRGESNRAKRQARNSPIQSLLSDYTLFQAGRLHQYILDEGKNWRIVDVVHDAVIAEVPYAEVKEFIRVTRKIMTDIHAFEKAFKIKMIVPMLVDFDVGIKYGDLKSVESWSKGEKSLKVALKIVKKQWKDKGYNVGSQKGDYKEAA